MNNDLQHITTLQIDELWHAKRTAEPVRVGVPFCEGVLTDDSRLTLARGGGEIPVQTRTLSRWPDGSVRWALVDFQADLDLREHIEIDVARRAAGGRPEPEVGVRIGEFREQDSRNTGLVVNTGVMEVVVATDGSPRVELSNGSDAFGVGIRAEESSLGEIELRVKQSSVAYPGPLACELVVEAEGWTGSDHIADVRLLLRFHAGKESVHAFVSIISRDRDIHISLLRVNVSPGKPCGSPQLRAHTSMKRARVSETELMYDFAVDARGDPIWYEDSPEPCWVAWRGDDMGVAASVRNPDHHFPTRLAATPEGLQLDLQPDGAEPFHMYPYMAKTKEVFIELVAPDKDGYAVTLDSALFQRPVRPYCDPNYHALCRAFGDIFPTSRKYGALEAMISLPLRERTVGVGAMHYGDEPNLGYTYSQRGHDELVWTNGEYDTPRMLLMQYARTANRSWFEAAEAAAYHWMDIDFLRDSPNPRWAGGMCCHEGDHRVAAYAGPSHEWAEGLVDYYHLTGYDEALRVAESVGDNVCRYMEDGEFDQIGTFALRELGWGLTAISGCLRATGKARYRETGLRAVRILRQWAEELGGFREVWRYSEPGREEEMMPLAVSRDAFVSLTLNGLNRFYLASGEGEALDLFLSEVEAQLKWFESPAGWAEQRETKLPNMEAFGYGYKYTQDRAYLEAGLQILDYALSNCTLRIYNLVRSVLDTSREHPSTYRLQEISAINSQILGLALIPMFSFLQTAEEAGVLEAWMGRKL